MQIEPFFDPNTSTLTYVVFDPDSGDAVVLDPVLDYTARGSKLSFESVDAVTAFVRKKGLKVHWILETHAHADHLSGAQVLRGRFPGSQVAIGARITVVQAVFAGVFELPADFATDGSQFDRLLEDGETIEAGRLTIAVIHTPGHTPACVTYAIEDALFTGDLLFMPDQGTGRCDFPAGSARDMYRSVVGRIHGWPDDTRMFVGHDYQPGGRPPAWETTVGAQKASNVHCDGDTTEDEFVQRRSARDATLEAPALLYQSVQANIGGGRLLQGRSDRRFLKVPVNIFRPKSGGDYSLESL